MIVTFYNNQSTLKIPEGLVEQITSSVMEEFKVSSTEVIIHFVDKEKICHLHKDHFNDPSPTDCISFPLDDPYTPGIQDHSILGEVFVCPEVAIEYATKHQIDPIQETALYVIHGLLHLLGYDDLTPKDRTEMRKQEKQLLKKYLSG